MCGVVEKFGRECAEETSRETAKNLFINGADYELVRASINNLTEEELRAIYNDIKGL